MSRAACFVFLTFAGLNAFATSALVAMETELPEDQSIEAAADSVGGETEPVSDTWSAPSSRLTDLQIDLRDRLRRCLAAYYHRPLVTSRRSPWAVMHSVVGFGVDTEVETGRQRVNAISWLCANAPCFGMRLMHLSDGRLGLRMGPGYQGHSGQFLCILAQSRVQRDYPLIIQGQQLRLQDLIQHEKQTCRSGSELTFKLIGLAHYLDSDAQWNNDLGQPWSISRLIEEELAQPVVGAACGGTHRMTGFAYAVRSRQREGKSLTGQWQRADTYLHDFFDHTFSLQNPDGSFSTRWFEGRGNLDDIDRKLETTGHTLEWLVFSVPREELDDARILLAVEFLVELMWENRDRDWEIGPLGHAIHALALYDEFVLEGRPGKRADQLATDVVSEEIDDEPSETSFEEFLDSRVVPEMAALEQEAAVSEREDSRSGIFRRRARR